VVVEQFVDQRDGGVRRGVQFPSGERSGELQGVGSPSRQADMDRDVLGTAHERDVGDEQSDESLALPHWRRRVSPQRGEILDQCPDADSVLIVQGGLR
jgi:hypothetical protein